MFFHNAIKKLHESDDFKKWRKENSKHFLSTGFIVVEKAREYPWMIGYFDTKTDKISSFVVSDKECYFEKVDEVFKKPEDTVFELNLEKVKIDVEKVLDLIETYCKEKYNHETIIKTILIIQNLPKHGNVWNVTLITQSFNAINMKINSEDGKLLEDKCSSLLSYGAPDTLADAKNNV
ncbi:MAG: hypothetical protein U9R08_02575 [Nanoarchaeota archaeon]|nr:hypothetical protein [Nanoarchaeota archaeon]